MASESLIYPKPFGLMPIVGLPPPFGLSSHIYIYIYI